MSRDDTLAEYRILRARCGVPTAEHVPSGILLHSSVDPIAEARALAAEYSVPKAGATALLGGGLGYLAEALSESGGEGHTVFVIEPDAALLQLARSCRGDVPYFSSPHIRRTVIASPSTAAERLSGLIGSAQLIVAPYFERIVTHLPSPLAGFVQLLRAERVSRVVYDAMLPEHRRINQDRLDSLPHAQDICLELGKNVVVAGAGPSLDECAPALRRHRSKYVLVAASGAIPPLRAAGIDPDWVVALEGKDTAVNDLADLPEKISTVVFECTHPQIVQAAHTTLYFGGGLETRGGTTLIPALDFALQCSMESVILVGADLGYGNRAYASGAKRECLAMSVPSGVPPKFLAMRTALENLLDRKLRAPRTVYHALRTGPALRGALRVQPDELGPLLAGLPAEKETV